MLGMASAEENLKAAFAGESQANRKYLAYAEKADSEGYPQAARLFRAAAAAETVHAHSHLRALKAIGATRDNLKDAIDGETHEYTSMYPEMLKGAQAEGHTDAVRSFDYALAVEKTHGQLYRDMLAGLDTAGKESYPYFVCPVCGHTVGKQAPDKCPVCATKGELFKRID
jgi:rubrerythrin